MMSHENRQPNNKNKDLESEGTPECPYLDTVERSLLDFDLERACSVTLSTGNIYACLICGKYFRGRGPQSPAYTHAVSESHYVFVSLDKGSFHCLPDDYVVQDIPDIRAALCPTFSAEQIRRIDFAEPSRDLFGRQYIPGFVGLSNLNKTDGINCVVQALAHVPPLRNYFLSLPSTESVSSVNASASSSTDRKLARQVTESFAGVVRKLWSRDRFKSNVDPHELIHSISVASQKKFGVGRQCEASELMTWLLHQLHIGTGGNHKAGSSIIHETFQGMLRVTTLAKKRRISPPHDEQADDFESGTDDEEKSVERVEGRTFSLPEYFVEESVADSPFLMLTLDLPDKPLFRNEDGGLVIPQEPLATVLKKFDGLTFSDVITKNGASQRKQYQLRRLPDFLILCLSRFKKNDYTRVKNPTIVAFPVKNLDLGQYVQPDASREAIPTREGIEGMKTKQLKMFLAQHGRKHVADAAVERNDLVDAAMDLVTNILPTRQVADKYDLLANITHVSPADVGREGARDALEEGYYKCHVQNRGTKQWIEFQDDNVTEILPQQIGLSENYVLIFERKSAQTSISDNPR